MGVAFVQSGTKKRIRVQISTDCLEVFWKNLMDFILWSWMKFGWKFISFFDLRQIKRQ